MATNSFLFKGWAITIAAALSAFAAVDTKRALLTIALVSTAMFWGLDGYYLWLERCFIKLHNEVAAMDETKINFVMTPNKDHAFCNWIKTCFRFHLLFFYGTIVAVDVIAIIVVRSK